MKKLMMGLMAVLMMLPLGTLSAADKKIKVSDFELKGEIEGENIVFTLAFDAEVSGKGVEIPLVVGDAAYLDGKFPSGAELVRNGNKFYLKLKSGGWRSTSKQSVMFKFASKPVKKGDWRQTKFSIPVANIRKLSVVIAVELALLAFVFAWLLYDAGVLWWWLVRGKHCGLWL